jgi:putative lipoic acid-binding regulatory protein
MIKSVQTHDDQPSQGFEFPGEFELSAMGPAEAGLERELPELLEAAGITVVRESIRSKASSAGRFVSVRIGFRAESRAQYEAAHSALRAHPEVKWTI